MRCRLCLGGALLTLALGASGAPIEERADESKKKTVPTTTVDNKTPAQFKRSPQAGKRMSKTSQSQLPTYIEPNSKMLGLGCASGED